jgi:O-antigen ligase
VFAFACGSSSVATIDRDGKHARWAMLVVLLVVAAGAAWRAAPRRLPRGFAAAVWLAVLATVSTLWSVDPRLTFERAGSFVLLVATAGLAAAACARPADAERALGGILAGAVLVALAGVALLAVDRGDALQHGSTGVPTRFRGLGESANTSSLLIGLALPLAVYSVLRAQRVRHRVAGALVFLLLDGSIVGSGSRAPLVAGFAAALGLVALAPARRVAFGAAVLVLLGLSVGLGTIPKPLASGSKPAVAAPAGPRAAPGYVNAEEAFPLEADIGRSLPHEGGAEAPRSLTGSSGRTEAWRGALHEAARRPVAGHGFGTEARVFVDRYFFFAGGLPENSYIGVLLQLGVVGLVSFLGMFALWFGAGARAWLRAAPRDRLTLAACAATLGAALVMAFVQSYFDSVGNIATLSLWLAGLLLVSAAAEVRNA